MGIRIDSIPVDRTGFFEVSMDWIVTRSDVNTEIQLGNDALGRQYGQGNAKTAYYLHRDLIGTSGGGNTGWSQYGDWQTISKYFTDPYTNALKRFVLFKRPQGGGCRFGLELYHQGKLVWQL